MLQAKRVWAPPDRVSCATQASGWRVLDTSTNGLCVNNVKVRSQQLQDGDVLLFEVPQTVGFGQQVPAAWEEKSHFRFRFCVQTAPNV